MVNVIYKGPSEWAVKVAALVEYYKEHGSKWTSPRNAGIVTWIYQGVEYVGMPYMTKSGLVCRVWEHGKYNNESQSND